MAAVIFDTETTGTDQPKLIEAAGIVLGYGEAIDLRPVGRFTERYNPGERSEPAALATHHILDEEVAGLAPAETFDIREWFVAPEDFQYLIGHNVDYDWEVIGKPEVRRICTLAIYRRLFPQLKSHTLGAVAYHVMRPVEARELLRHKAHGAAADCEVVRHVLGRCIKGICHPTGYPKTWEGLWRFSEDARIPTHFPFGKHKGEPIAELPRDYIEWALKNLTDIDGYLRAALEQQLR